MVTTRVGAPSLDITAVADTASVGATAAANASAGAQPSPGRTSRVTQATPTIVTAVVPTARAVIGTAFSLVSLGAVRKAALYTSGGRNSTSTTSGDRAMFGTCGIRLASTPSTTNTTASGTSSRVATAGPMITTTAMATVSVKSSCSLTRLRSTSRARTSPLTPLVTHRHVGPLSLTAAGPIRIAWNGMERHAGRGATNDHRRGHRA